MLKRITIFLALLLAPVAAFGQSSVIPYYYNSSGVKQAVGSSFPLPITGSFSATTTGFPTIQTTGTPISVTTGGVSGNLPSGAVVVASNVGTTNAAYCKLGASATTSDQYIAPSGGWFAFTVGANSQLTCITSTSTTTVNMVGGSGLPTGTGGGSGGGGSGGSVTQGTDPWLIAGKGTAGSASGGVVTVQGDPSMTPLLSTLSAETTKVIGTVRIASGGVASGAVASGAIASGAFASGSIGSGAVASGAYASGAFASGALASGSVASGAMVDLGAIADAAATAGSTGTVNAKLRLMTTQLDTLNTNVTSPPPLNVNAVNTAWTGLTPGVAQTGTIIAGNMDLSSVAGIALGAMANYGTSPGAVKVQGVNAFVTNFGTGTAGSAAGGVVTVQGAASMTKLLVTPDSVALPANQSVNVAQVGGTNTVNGGVAGSQSVGGTVATNVAITANPLNLGAQAVSSENGAVTTARQVQLVADLVGKLITLPYANPENFVQGTTAAMTGTTSTSLVAAPGGSLRNYITHISCVNSHASVGTFVSVQDGSGGTTLMTLAAGANFSGDSKPLVVPLKQPTAATALFVANVTTGANVICNAIGYKGL